MEKLKELETENAQYKTQLQKLSKQMEDVVGVPQSAPKPQSSLPPIQNDEEKHRLREELEADYFRQRKELKDIDKKTKEYENQAEQLKVQLKEKESLLRIAQFKLSEINRKIKRGPQDMLDAAAKEKEQKDLADKKNPRNFMRSKTRRSVLLEDPDQANQPELKKKLKLKEPTPKPEKTYLRKQTGMERSPSISSPSKLKLDNIKP